MIQRWMNAAGFVKCERRLTAHITCEFIGLEVLRDPILHKNGTSQLSLLTEEAFAEGMARIRKTLHLAERRGEKVVFTTHIALPTMVGFVPDTAESFV